MKENQSLPHFDAKRYERPTQKWVCGQSANGDPCRLGPSPRGGCQAGFECQPFLEVKPGESKGRYRCTRPASLGGPCAPGPLPDGTCARAVPKCTPVRSLRSKRGLVSLYVVAFTVALLLIGLGGPWKTRLVTPGGLSVVHSGPAFVKRAGTTNLAECAGCHRAANSGIAGWVEAALRADPGPFHFGKLGAAAPARMDSIDEACRTCHQQRTFHQPNIEQNVSCSICHKEHLGDGPMQLVQAGQCVACHGNPDRMQQFTQAGHAHPPAAFARVMPPGLNLFPVERPAEGYTRLIHGFATDHPEFQLQRGPMRENNPLRFNHEFHLNPANVKTNLDCRSCHQPDASGAFHRQITFAQSCSGCHALQFDANNPELTLPHGNPAHVRAFLRSLPTQYAAHASRSRGLIEQTRVDDYVRSQMEALRQQFGSGEILEEKVFFSDKRWAPAPRIGSLPASGRSLFYGCAYCHEVARGAEGLPAVRPVFIPDRWMQHSTFNHAKHAGMDCASCHRVKGSRDTADVLMPGRRDCTQCHSPKGGVSDSCMTCHTYHRPDPRTSTTVFTQAEQK